MRRLSARIENSSFCFKFKLNGVTFGVEVAAELQATSTSA